MKILDIKDYKKLTDEQIKNLIEETEENIYELNQRAEELYDELNNNSFNTVGLSVIKEDTANSDEKSDSIKYKLGETCYWIDILGKQLDNLEIFRTARKEYSYYCEKDIYKNYKCDECGRVNDLTLSEKSDDILEFRGYCYCCNCELFKVIKKNPF